jgi:hypothetical protein
MKFVFPIVDFEALVGIYGRHLDWHRTHAYDQATGILGLSEHRLYSGGCR